jgi:hypothetical protein
MVMQLFCTCSPQAVSSSIMALSPRTQSSNCRIAAISVSIKLLLVLKVHVCVLTSFLHVVELFLLLSVGRTLRCDSRIREETCDSIRQWWVCKCCLRVFLHLSLNNVQAFLFSSPIQVNLIFEDEEVRKKLPIQTEKKGIVDHLVFKGKESVKGKIELKVSPGKSVQHQGISAELVGQIGE